MSVITRGACTTGKAMYNKKRNIIEINEVNKDTIGYIMKEGIVFIQPLYIPEVGLHTKILTEKREIISNRSVDIIIDLMLYENMMSRSALKEKTSKVLNQRNVLPLCVDAKNLMIPFKMINPIGRDNSIGYINYQYIKGALDLEAANSCKIDLGEYGVLTIMSTMRTAQKHFRECVLAAVLLLRCCNLDLVR